MSADRDVRYADSGGLQIAYEVIGDGPRDIVIAFDWASNIDLIRVNPRWSRVFERFAEIGRTILFDMRGVGLSDPVDRLPSPEVWADDVLAVMNAAGSSQAALIGFGQAAQLALMFAATNPRQTTGVVSVNGFACLRQDAGYPFGFSPEAEQKAIRLVSERWGSGRVLSYSSPGLAQDADGAAWVAVAERAAGSPRRAALKQARAFDIDVRGVLSAITVPTLVIHSESNRYVTVDHARYLVDHIAGSQYLEVSGAEHIINFASEDGSVLADAVEEFLTGYRRPAALDRALRTVVFTDIVGSTELASSIGDHKWRSLLEAHELLARRTIEVARGQLIKFTGDGVMATFDGPARAVNCVRAMNADLQAVGLPIRAGIHTGEVELIGDDIGGIAVHIAARISAMAGPGEILTSSTVRDLVAGSGLEFVDRGEHELKGVPGTWRVLAAT